MWSIYGSKTAVSETAISQLQNRTGKGTLFLYADETRNGSFRYGLYLFVQFHTPSKIRKM